MDFPYVIDADQVNLSHVSIAGPDAPTLATNINRMIAQLAIAQPGAALRGYDIAGSGDGANYVATLDFVEAGIQDPTVEIPIFTAFAFCAETGEAGGDVSAVENIAALIANPPANLAELSALLQPSATIFSNAIAAVLPLLGMDEFVGYGLKAAGSTSGRRFTYLTIGTLVGGTLEEVIEPLAVARDAPAHVRAMAESYNLRAGAKPTPAAIAGARKAHAARAERKANAAELAAAKKAPAKK
jgi:hypothetical protein